MRIRKTASKVLGLSSSFRHEDSDSEYHCAAAPPEELLLCQLNCSPWDVLDLESNLHHFTFQDGGEGDEGRGIMGNGFKFEDYEEILANAEEAAAFTSFGSSAAVDEAELNSEEDGNGDDKKATKKKKKKKRRRRKRKEEVIINVIRDEDKVVATKNSSISITYCKKNDGKGWQCKRPAKRQHSLCDHHLDLLRNYSSRTNSRESYESEADHHQAGVKNQRPKAVAAAAESAGDGFYYYSGFGPWRGKKRSSGTIADHARPKEAASDDEDDDADDDEKGEERKDESGDGSDAPVAGDDLDDDTNDEEDGIENKGRYNKKGRKRVKARSLKSLM